ncbi:hypothetical protein Peur_073658 [Populus x canadensis]
MRSNVRSRPSKLNPDPPESSQPKETQLILQRTPKGRNNIDKVIEPRPVILPLPGAGGCRCSVKPASRIAPHFRRQVAQAFAGVTWLSSWLGTGRPDNNHAILGPLDKINVPSS